MYAVFEDGSRQYRVSEGDILRLDYREADKGARVEFPRVLLLQTGSDAQIGAPLLAGVRVLAEVLEQTSEKYFIQKFRKRKNYRRFKGHRQPYTKVRVQHILGAGQEAPAAPPPAEKPAAPSA